MTRIKLSIHSLDLFMPDLKLNLQGQPGVGTKVGVGLSMVFLGVFGFLAYIIVSDFLDTKKPIVSQTIASTELPPFISFAEDKLYPILIFRHLGSARLDKEQLARFVTVHLTKVEVRADETGATTTSFSTMKVARCSELVAQGKLKSFHVTSKVERDLLLNEGVCVDPGEEDATLGRRTTRDPVYQQYMWRVFPCSLPSGCATREELSMLTFSSIIPKPNLDLSNKLEPVRYDTLMDEVTYLSTSLTGRLTINLMKSEIVDEAGFLQAERTVKSFTVVASSSYGNSDRNPAQLSCSASQFAIESGCTPYWQQTLLTHPRKMVIKRQYKGMVESFSELGGMMDILFMIFLIPYRIYNSHVLKQRLVEVVHGVKKPRKSTVKPAHDSNLSLKHHTETYNLLLDGIDSCLDLVHLTKVVNHLQRVIKLQGLEQEDSPRRASLYPQSKVPNARSSEPVLDSEFRKLEESPHHPGKALNKPQKSLFVQMVPICSKEVRISDAGKTRAIQLLKKNPDPIQLEKAAEIRQFRTNLKAAGRRPDQPIGRDHLESQIGESQRKKEENMVEDWKGPKAALNEW